MIDNNKKTHLIVTGRGGGDQVQADWNQTDTEQLDYIKNKPELATVATTGSYNDLTDKPTIPTQVQADWNETDTTDPSYIQNKPTILTQWFGTQAEYDLIDPKDPNVIYNIEGSDNVQADWNQSDSSADDYIKNKPTIPAAQVNSDWNANSGVAQILNKPNLATVATSGNYSDLNGTPTLATVATSGDYDDLQNKPTIPVVPTNVSAFTNDAGYTTFDGDYNSLTNKPTIPAAQVNSDWNASSGVAQILNKPTLATVATTGSYNDLTDKPTVTQEQADWNQSDNTQVDYIKNKPTIPTVPAMATETLTFTLQGGTTKTLDFFVLPDYFYVENTTGGSGTLTIKKQSSSAPNIEVFKSDDKMNWSSMGTTDTTGITATVLPNSKLYLKATTTAWNGNTITMSVNHNVGGNITSLVLGDNISNDGNWNSRLSQNTFSQLFYNNTNLVNAGGLEIPCSYSTDNNMFNNMFNGCTALTTAPKYLKASYASTRTFSQMFNGCTSLVNAPYMEIDYGSNYVFANMFNGCSSLNRLVTNNGNMGANSYNNWLEGVAATGDLYCLRDVLTAPDGWTLHTSL